RTSRAVPRARAIRTRSGGTARGSAISWDAALPPSDARAVRRAEYACAASVFMDHSYVLRCTSRPTVSAMAQPATATSKVIFQRSERQLSRARRVCTSRPQLVAEATDRLDPFGPDLFPQPL